MKSVFGRDMCVDENTSRPANVRIGRLRRTVSALPRAVFAGDGALSPARGWRKHFFDSLGERHRRSPFLCIRGRKGALRHGAHGKEGSPRGPDQGRGDLTEKFLKKEDEASPPQKEMTKAAPENNAPLLHSPL